MTDGIIPAIIALLTWIAGLTYFLSRMNSELKQIIKDYNTCKARRVFQEDRLLELTTKIEATLEVLKNDVIWIRSTMKRNGKDSQ